jgi:hypothetical protein
MFTKLRGFRRSGAQPLSPPNEKFFFAIGPTPRRSSAWRSCATADGTTSQPTRSAAPSTRTSSRARPARPTTSATCFSTPAPGASSTTGRPSRTTPRASCVPKRRATRTTRDPQSSSRSCHGRAPNFEPSGQSGVGRRREGARRAVEMAVDSLADAEHRWSKEDGAAQRRRLGQGRAARSRISGYSGYCVDWRYVTRDRHWVMVRDTHRSIKRGGWVFIPVGAFDPDRSKWKRLNERGTCNQIGAN